MFLSYFLFAFLPLILTSILSYNYSINSIRNEAVNAYTQTQNQRIEEINQNMSRFKLIADAINNNGKVHLFLASSHYSNYEKFSEYTKNVKPFLDTLINSVGNQMIIGLVRYDAGEEIIFSNFENILSDRYASTNPIAFGLGGYYIINRERAENHDWFREAESTRTNNRWVQISKDSENGNISLVKQMSYYSSGTQVTGLLRLTLPLDSVLGEHDQTSEGFDMVFDEKNAMMTSSDWKKSYYRQNMEEIDRVLLSSDPAVQVITQDNIVVKNVVGNTGWTIISIFQLNSINGKISQARYYMLIYSAVAVMLLLMVTFVLSSSFSKRLARIVNVIKDFHHGNENTIVNDDHDDEIGYLSRAFNSMKQKQENLIHDIYQVGIEKKDAQLKALQAQINPHFLYNSMSAIGRLAESEQYKSIIDIVNALVMFYRMTLNKGEDIISIKDELAQIEAYINIFKIRKGNQFTVTYHFDDAVVDYSTVKTILQPFVENIFDHAMHPSKIPVNINIWAQIHDNEIVFRIIDDGIGMSGERLNEIKECKEIKSGHSSYGIKNVDDRVKLFFGAQYGVTISSVYGGGTFVEIKIPKFKSISVKQ